MKKLIYIGIISMAVSIIAILISLFYNNDQKKLAVVDLQRVFSEFSYTLELEASVDSEFRSKRAYIDSLEMSLKRIEMQLLTGRNSDLEQQHSIIKNQWEIESISFENAYTTKIEESNEKIWGQLNQYISDFGKEKNYDIVFGASGDGKIMYAKDEVDVTEEVIEYVNNKYAGL